jgi:hypothetical protein
MVRKLSENGLPYHEPPYTEDEIIELSKSAAMRNGATFSSPTRHARTPQPKWVVSVRIRIVPSWWDSSIAPCPIDDPRFRSTERRCWTEEEALEFARGIDPWLEPQIGRYDERFSLVPWWTTTAARR